MADNQPTQVKNETGQPKLTRQQSARADSKAVQAKFVGRAKQKNRFAIQVASIAALFVLLLIVLLAVFNNEDGKKKVSDVSRISVVRPAVESEFHTLEPGKEVWVQTPSSFSWYLHEGDGFYAQFFDRNMRPVKFRMGSKVVGPRPVLIDRTNIQTPFTYSAGARLRITAPKERVSVVEIRLGEGK